MSKTKEERRQYYRENRATLLDKYRIWGQRTREKHRHPCKDCSDFCSQFAIRCKKCYYILQKKTHNFFLVGKNHPKWKGKTQNAAGYILVRMPKHPRVGSSGYIMEHILIWEQAHNKPLPDGWIIHHLNGIKDDNRLVNLQAIPNRKHYLILQAKAKRIQELEGLLNNQGHLL